MATTYRGERGGLTALRASSALKPTHDASRLQISQSSDRLHRQPLPQNNLSKPNTKSSMTTATTKSTVKPSNVSTEDQQNNEQSPPPLNFPSPNTVAQSELLQETVFPTWKDDAANEVFETPEDLQREDPLGTQIWKLYSKTKTRLPNQERMENLTWRMMAMNLKRREREQAMYTFNSPSCQS